MSKHRTLNRIAFCLPIAILLFAVGAFTPAAGAAEVKTLAIGAAAPDFALPGVDGKEHTLAEYKDAKVLVVIFTSNHCPTAQAYEERIKQLHADFKDKGVALVAINPNDPLALRLDELAYTDLNDSLEEMKLRAAEKGFEFPYLDDGGTQAVSKAYGVQATPHVYIFDAGRTLRYVGRIDDAEVKTPTSHDARNAIEAMLAGKPVAVEKTNVFGCSTKWSDKRDEALRAVAEWDKEPVALAPIDAPGVKALAANEGEGAKLRLINVWATWCGPCITELPELVTIHRTYRGRGLEVVTISMDEPGREAMALAMLTERHVSGENYRYASDDRDALVEALDAEWEGPVPFTVLIAPGGKVLYRQTGAFDALELKRAIVGHLGRTY